MSHFVAITPRRRAGCSKPVAVDIVKPPNSSALHRHEIRELAERICTRNPRILGSALPQSRYRDERSRYPGRYSISGAALLELAGLHVLLEELPGVQADHSTPGDLRKRARV